MKTNKIPIYTKKCSGIGTIYKETKKHISVLYEGYLYRAEKPPNADGVMFGKNAMNMTCKIFTSKAAFNAYMQKMQLAENQDLSFLDNLPF